MSLSATDFAYVSDLVRRKASIVLAPGKEYLVEARLLPIARQLGASSVAEFIGALQRQPNPDKERRVIDALTTNETSWFRDREPFTALRDVVLPELLETRAVARKVRVWSAACSSGQEPYSLAMVLDQALPAGWSYDVLGSDISTEMIKRAEAGQYSQVEVNRGLPAQLLVHYFERAGAHWKITPALCRNVTFQRLNLTAPQPTVGTFDVIFLRNVLIYFDVPTKRTVLQNVSRHLRPGGYLFLGAAETTIGIDDGFERVTLGRAAAYRSRAALSDAGTGR